MDAGFKSSTKDPYESYEGPWLRILICSICKSIDELPDWQGRPEEDVLLNITVERHVAKHGETESGQLCRFPLPLWTIPKYKEMILQQIKDRGSSGLDVYGTNFYQTKSQFGEDAMTCWGLHNRPAGQCPDYKSEKKLLKPDTKLERKDAGLSAPGTSGPKIYLCDFCPVKSYNMKKYNQEHGLYN